MSQLRKSASFRSRIPVRRPRIIHRRCCSPSPGIGGCSRVSSVSGISSIGAEQQRSNHKLRTNRSFGFESDHRHHQHYHKGKKNSHHHHHHYQNFHHNHHHHFYRQSSANRRYSSSSFSSSDESYESEAPHQKFTRQTHQAPIIESSMYISTDAISLDGLLDSVSSGSFSSPPSPVQYENTNMALSHSSSYESLDKYNAALETFKLSENVAHISYPLAVPQATHCSQTATMQQHEQQHQQQQMSHTQTQSQSYYTNINEGMQQPTGLADGGGGLSIAEAAILAQKEIRKKKSYYKEKQKQLSDWYYIKSKKDSIDDEDDDEDGNGGGGGKGETEKDADKETNERNDEVSNANVHTGTVMENDAMPTTVDETLPSMEEHNYVNNVARILSESSQPRRVPLMGGSAGYAQCFSPLYVNSTQQQRQGHPHNHHHHPQRTQQSNWNNFDCHRQQQQQQLQARNNESMTFPAHRQKIIHENNVNSNKINNQLEQERLCNIESIKAGDSEICDNGGANDDYDDDDDADADADADDDEEDDDVLYDETIDSINRRPEHRSNDEETAAAAAAAASVNFPPYYCPPVYNAQNYWNHNQHQAAQATNASRDDSANTETGGVVVVDSVSALREKFTATAHNVNGGSGGGNGSVLINAGNGVNNVNVNLLKQHYQQQQEISLNGIVSGAARNDNGDCGEGGDGGGVGGGYGGTAEYANMSFRKRNACGGASTSSKSTTPGRRNKNKVELQLEHWENISNANNVRRHLVGNNNNKGGSSASASASRSHPSNRAIEVAGYHQSSQENKAASAMSSGQATNHLFARSSSTSNCCFNNGPTKNTKQNNASSSSSSTNINNNNKPSRSNIFFNQQQQQQQQEQHHPLEPSGPIQCSAATIQQLPLNQKRTKQQQQPQQQHHHHHHHHSHQTTTPELSGRGPRYDGNSPRITPPTATPRAALRSRLIQKRSDETSCSSFEQLNIIGIPTTDENDERSSYRYRRRPHRYAVGGGKDEINENSTAAVLSSLRPMPSIAAGHNHCGDVGVIVEKKNTKDGKDEVSKDDYGGVDGDYYGDERPMISTRSGKARTTAATDTMSKMEAHYADNEGLLVADDIAAGGGGGGGGNSMGAFSEVRRLPADSTEINRRPLPEIPHPVQLHRKLLSQRQHQNQFQQRSDIGSGMTIFPPKTTSCRSDCELSGSYASLECPSPPGPPVCLPESRRDPQARLGTYLRTFYTDLSLKEPIIPPWAIPVAPGALCPARLEPDLRLNSHSHGYSDALTVDQILTSVQTKEGTFLEAPRRCLIECPTWASRSNLCLRILHAWAKEPPWPAKGTPVALALFIPLTELKRSFANYVEKELLPKGPLHPFANGFGGFNAAWNSLESLGPKLLILLDGYDSQRIGLSNSSGGGGGGTPKRGKSGGGGGGSSAGGSSGGGGSSSGSGIGIGSSKHLYPSDVHDLLDGKLFPEARIIITTSSANCTELLPIIQRHITYDGLTWGRSASLLGGGQWGGPSRLLDTVQECPHLRKAVRTPLGCLALAAIYEATAGDLPNEELDVVESILNCVAPETSAINVAELGRLALFCLKMKRTCITMAEIRMYCSSPDSNIMGCLDKHLLLGKTAKKKSEYVYHPICAGMLEFLAATYIASLANRPGLLAAEITGLSIGDELDPDLLKVIRFSMGLLGDRAHILLSRLTPLWLTPQIVFSLALAGGHTEENLAALCDILGISKHPPISPLESKPLWVQVRSVSTDLMGWGMALKSPTCTLKNLEVTYQLEKNSVLESRTALEIFLDSISLNESVSTLRLSSLIETEVKDSEISYLATVVSKLLLKPRLENFELVLTLLEEDPPILKLQSVVAALCRAIPRQPKLSYLLLDLGLSTSQLVQLSATLEKCPNVTRLSLPHLRCERGAISALASLLNSRPLSFLSLPSCWGARDDPPSSSGVSMGSGSGSSTGTSGLIKQGSLPGVPSPRSYAPGIFSSLPRGVFVPPTSFGRSATLPRQPLEQSLDKRSCDSVVSKTWYPTPACDGGPHNSGTLHDLLLAARESYSKLHGLDLSKAQLSLEDSMCLGETVRLSTTLHTLKLEGSSRLSEILPSVLGASESPCLQMLSVGSPRLSLEDSAIAMCARALTSCSTLRLLSLDGWNFRIENTSTLSILRAFLSLTSIRELSLANCRLQIGLIKSDVKIVRAFESRSVVVLKLAGAQATLADSNVLRGPQLLPYVGGFPCLRELDLSAPARSGLGSTHSSPLILDDKCIVSFFQNLHTHFGLLNTLKICNWVIHFDELSRTFKTISKCIRNSPISHLKLDGISVLDRPKKQRIESNFIHCFISSLPQLRWMGISLAGKKEEQVTAIGNAVLDLKGYEIDIKLSESTIEHAKLMAQAISLDGKFDIKVSTFGTSSGILIHAEKSGTKSLTRKNKD